MHSTVHHITKRFHPYAKHFLFPQENRKRKSKRKSVKREYSEPGNSRKTKQTSRSQYAYLIDRTILTPLNKGLHGVHCTVYTAYSAANNSIYFAAFADDVYRFMHILLAKELESRATSFIFFFYSDFFLLSSQWAKTRNGRLKTK